MALVSVAAASAAIAVPASAQETAKLSSPAPAPQDAAADASTAPAPDGDIIVTAEKHAEDRKNVPSSVEVISGERLEANGVQNGLDVVKYLPGFGLDASAEVRTVTLKTRGIGTFTNSIGIQSSNLIAIDDEVLPRQTALSGAVLDLERVEALRGPQGTLFGENTSTGLIHYITRRPKLGETSGRIEADAAQYDDYGGRAVLNLGLTDTLAARFNGSYDNAGGYLNNTYGGKLGANKTYGGRGQILFQPNSRFHMLLRAELSQTDTNCCQAAFLTPTLATRYPALVITNGVPVVSALNAVNPQPYDPNNPIVAVNPNQFATIKNFGVSTEVSGDVGGNVNLTYSGSYRNFRLANNTDTYDTPYPISRQTFGGTENTKTMQHEVRLSSYGNKTFNWVAGLFYHVVDGNRDEANDACTTGSGSTGNPRLTNGVFDGCFTSASIKSYVTNYTNTGRLNNALLVPDRRLAAGQFSTSFENYAVFGQMNINLTRKLDLELGGRLLHENSSADYTETVYKPSPTSVGLDTLASVEAQGNTLVRATGSIPPTHLEDQVTRFIYKAVVGYDVTNDIRLYANYSTGFKGVSYFITANTDPANLKNIAVKPETSRNIEFGFRSKLFDNKLALNITLFQMDVDNYQIRATTVLSETTGAVYVGLVNAEQARSRGVEVDATLRPVQNLSIYGSFAYFHAVYNKFSAAPQACPGGTLQSRCYTDGGVSLLDESGLPFPNNAEKQLYVSANYDIPLGSSGWTASVRGDFRYQSDHTLSVSQIANNYPASPGYNVTDLYLGIRNQRYRAQFFVKNLFNKFYATEENVSAVGEVSAYYPRDYRRYVGGSFALSF